VSTVFVQVRLDGRFGSALIAGVAAATLLVTLQPSTAAAQPVPRAHFSTEEALGLFVNAGYQVDPPRTWDWLSPAVSTFQVHDLERGRVVLVAVYPDVANAQRGSEQLVAGYSASTWIDNLAMFEASSDAYQREMATAVALSSGMQADQASPVVADVTPTAPIDVEYTTVVFNAQEPSEP
jgi:hypothetical protein